MTLPASIEEYLPIAACEDAEQLESSLLNLPQVACDVIHRFGPGIYIREVFIPAGTFAIGHWQKYEHMNVFLKGAVLMVKEDGRVEEMRAPVSFVGKPGRKIGYVTEDMYWQNIYATNEKDIEKLEEMFFDKDATFTNHKAQRLAFERMQKEEDRLDFHRMLSEIGMTKDQVDAQAFDISDTVELPLDNYKIMISDSPIDGRGLFATAQIQKGEIVSPARINGKRTQAGRYANHSATPNALMVSHPSGDIYLVASKNINGMQGGLPGEEITIDYRQAIAEVYLCQQ